MTAFKGVVFDLDGVVTRTVQVHSLAWKSMFDGYLLERSQRDGQPFSEFTTDDYQRYVDGRPRMLGVQAFLASRGIAIPFGDLADAPGTETVCGLGNAKNADFNKILEQDGPEVYATTVSFIEEILRRDIKVGIASSSRNCKHILELAGLEHLFATRVDGEESLRLGLAGKPQPDIFLTAAANLGLAPGECVVVEDAISGVQAGAAGNFGLVLGLARDVRGEVLLANGADMVVADLGETSVDAIEEWFDTGLERDGWTFGYVGFDPDREKLRETLTSVGNGYVGVRGALETERAGAISYPGTYLAGVFNKSISKLHGENVYNNDLVNCPNWLLVQFRIGDGEFVSPFSLRMLSYRHGLRMADGTSGREVVVQDQLGRIMRICSARFASMADPHLLALRFTVEPVNFSAPITLRSALDGEVLNEGVSRYSALNQRNLELVQSGATADGVFLHVQTLTSKYRVAMAARTQLHADGRKLALEKTLVRQGALIGEEMTVPGQRGVSYTLEKTVCVHTSLDHGDSATSGVKGERGAALKAAMAGLERAGSYRQLYGPHARAWKRLWKRGDIIIEGDRFVQRATRLHAYHLMSAATHHNAKLDASIPARGLTGEAYRGHIFWDEVYILPFYDLRFPGVSRALIQYRYNRLDAARRYAAEHGCTGAMYPWQTADDGGEETADIHYNPASDSWVPDLSRRQRHVSIAVFYNAWRYARTTEDGAFLKRYGAELMLSIAQFWGSIARKDAATGKYHIDGVMGPDEYHEKMPGAATDGVRDNGYTNIMASWLLSRSLEMVRSLPGRVLTALMNKLGLAKADFDRWEEIAGNLNVIVRDGVIAQFDGYFELKELDWEYYRQKYGDIYRLDRLLKAEGDSPDGYQLAKQADTLMTFYLLSAEQVKDILARLGVPVGDAVAFLKRNYDYYEPRTTHGSTLSRLVHAVIAANFGDDAMAWQWFMEALVSDINDIQGGTTPEGIHTGVMAGTLDVVTQYFAGVDTSGDVLAVNPHLPTHFTRLALPIRFKRIDYALELTHGELKITAAGKQKSVRVLVQDRDVELTAGKATTINLK